MLPTPIHLTKTIKNDGLCLGLEIESSLEYCFAVIFSEWFSLRSSWVTLLLYILAIFSIFGILLIVYAHEQTCSIPGVLNPAPGRLTNLPRSF